MKKNDKFYLDENDEEGYEIWSTVEDEEGDHTLVAVVFDLDLAETILDLLNAEHRLEMNKEDVYEEDDKEYGEAVDDFIKHNDYSQGWGDDSQ